MCKMALMAKREIITFITPKLPASEFTPIIDIHVVSQACTHVPGLLYTAPLGLQTRRRSYCSYVTAWIRVYSLNTAWPKQMLSYHSYITAKKKYDPFQLEFVLLHMYVMYKKTTSSWEGTCT